MREVAICYPLRTPVGRFLGALEDVPAAELAATVIRAIVARSGIDSEQIDDVILGHGYASGEEPALGRLAALKAGLPIEVPGYQVDRRCGSGLQAVLNAAMMVQTGVADVVLAGGADNMSRVEFYTTDMRKGSRLGSVTLHDRLVRARATVSPEERFGPIAGMIETAENLAREYDISREAQDEYALRSHRHAVAAVAAGRFAAEIVPVAVPQRRGAPVLHASDEGPRADTSLESLAKLQPIQRDGTVTAGNASSQNDAAAACLVVGADLLEELDLEPMALLRGWAVAGCHPATMGIGPVPAVSKLFERTGLGWNDIDLVELNEAFAAQVLAVLEEWRQQGFDDDTRLNVNGSGISLGHPIAATGARILTSLLHEMERRGARYGLETMCIGGGQGLAAVFERA
jgi:acetyl-CoA C-acetyltransferase